MKEPQVITVAMAEPDSYGNLKVTDTLGNEYKIGEKRSPLHPLFVQGRAIKLTWANFNKIDYVSGAELFDPTAVTPQPQQEPSPKPPGILLAKPAPQELGMWYKEMGARIGDGSLEKDYPKSFVQIKSQYYKRMFEVTGIEREPKLPVKQPGEVEPEDIPF